MLPAGGGAGERRYEAAQEGTKTRCNVQPKIEKNKKNHDKCGLVKRVTFVGRVAMMMHKEKVNTRWRARGSRGAQFPHAPVMILELDVGRGGVRALLSAAVFARDVLCAFQLDPLQPASVPVVCEYRRTKDPSREDPSAPAPRSYREPFCTFQKLRRCPGGRGHQCKKRVQKGFRKKNEPPGNKFILTYDWPNALV